MHPEAVITLLQQIFSLPPHQQAALLHWLEALERREPEAAQLAEKMEQSPTVEKIWEAIVEGYGLQQKSL